MCLAGLARVIYNYMYLFVMLFLALLFYLSVFGLFFYILYVPFLPMCSSQHPTGTVLVGYILLRCGVNIVVQTPFPNRQRHHISLPTGPVHFQPSPCYHRRIVRAVLLRWHHQLYIWVSFSLQIFLQPVILLVCLPRMDSGSPTYASGICSLQPRH